MKRKKVVVAVGRGVGSRGLRGKEKKVEAKECGEDRKSELGGTVVTCTLGALNVKVCPDSHSLLSQLISMKLFDPLCKAICGYCRAKMKNGQVEFLVQPFNARFKIN